MGYHDRDTFTRQWNTSKETKEEVEQPRIQAVSPHKKLIDIQHVLNNLNEQSVMTADDLRTKIQRILDGE